MSKQYFFFKNLVRGALDDNTFFTLWELLESWISQNNWMAIFFIIFLGIIFEIALIKIYTSFKKTPALSEESSNPEESEDDNYSSHSSSEERVDQFSGRTISSSLLSEENEGNFENTVPLAEEMMWAGTCDSRYQVSHLSESYMSSSNGSNSPLFHSEIKEVFVSQGGSSGNEEQTVQYSSKKLFSIMKTNKNKTVMFSSDFNFSRTSRISSETEDPDVAPCPPAHLFLSRDQVRLLEENVRQQIPLKSKATLEKKVTNLSSRSQESLVQNHHPAQMNISAQTQDSPGENVNQNQSFYDAQLICQPQQFVYNQQVISCQHDTEVRSFALPQNLVRRPQSSSTQESIHAQVVDRSEHLVQDPCSVKTQDSVKSTESDKHFDEAQCSVRRRDSDKKEESLWKQNNVLKNARHLDLTLTPSPVTHRMPQLERMKTKVQEQIASSDSNQYSVSDPTPVLPERQKIQRKISHSKSKFSPKVPSEKPKKAASSQAHQNTGYRMSKHRKLGCNYNTKKMKELYQRKETSGKPLSLTCVSKLFVPYIKKYSRKNLVEVMSSLNIYTDFLLKQDKSLDAEVDKAGSIEERGASSDTENIKQQSRDNKGLKTTAPKISPQVEQSFTVNTFQLEVSCSSSVEINWKNKESLKGPVIQGKGIGIAEFFQALKSKGTCDLCTPKHQTLLAETVSEPMQDFVSSPNMKSNRSLKTKEELRSTEEPRPPLSDTEKVPTNPPERSFPKGNTHCKALRIVLESPDANLLISLETKKHDSSERPAGIDMQEGTGEVIWKKETPFSLHITGSSDLNESEGLEYSRASTRDEVSGAPLRTAHTATSGPPDREVLSRLRAKTEASSIVDATLSAVRQEELPDEKMAENTEEKCRSKKPHRHDKEEEEQALREAALEQTEDFRFSLELKLQSKPVQFEIEQISSGKRQTPSEEWAAQTQTVSTQTIWETSPRPRVGLCQAEKQRADSPMDTEDAGPQNPPQPEELPVGASSVQTFGSCVPSSNDPKKIPGHIAEEKQDIRASPVVASGSWVSHVLHSSYLKSQEIRKVLSGTHSAFRPQCVVMKAKEPTLLLTAPSSRRGISSYRKRCRKSIIKNQKPQDETVTDVLLNATYPHRSTSPHSRLPSGVNTENHSLTKLTHEKSQVEREEQCSDFVIKGDDAGCRSDAKLHDEVRGGETVPPQTAPSAHRDPHMELPTEKEMQWPGPAAEAPVAPPYSPDREPALREKGRLETHGRFRCAAVSKVTPSPGASRAGNALKQTREHDGPGYENDLGHFFVEKDLSEDSAAASPGTFSCHIPILCYSKGRKHRESFSHGQCKERSKSVHVKTGKPSMPRILSITGHGRKLESNFKAKCEKIILADRLVHGFLHTLYSPGPGRLQRDRFGHPQLLRGELAVSERRPPCADAPAYVQDAFSDREEKVKDGKEKEQNAVPEAAPQRARSLQPSADQRETHMGQPDPARRCLMWEPPVREQDARRGARFPETAAHPGLWPGPSKAQDIEKTDKTGSGLTAHLGAEILPPRSGTASSDQRLNTAPGVKEGKEVAREHAGLPAPEASQDFLSDACQKEDQAPTEWEEELKRSGNTHSQVQPQTHLTPAILGSASSPLFYPFQQRELEGPVRSSPSEPRAAKTGGIAPPAGECGSPSGTRHQKEPRPGGAAQEEAVTLDFYEAVSATPRRKRNFKQYSDLRTLVSSPQGMRKANKPSVVRILSAREGASSHRGEEPGRDPSPSVEEMDPGKKMAASVSPIMARVPDSGTYGHTRRKKDMSGAERLISQRVKQMATALGGTVPADETKEASHPDEEEEGELESFLRDIPQHSQHFIFCSGQTKEFEPREQQFEHNLNSMLKHGQSVADVILNAISSIIAASPDMHHRTEVEADSLGEMGVLQQAHPTTPSNTTHRKEPREKEEDDALTTSPAPGPHTSQHPGARPLCVADLGPYSLEGRGTWNLSCMVRKLNQEKHICETIWKPVSRHGSSREPREEAAAPTEEEGAAAAGARGGVLALEHGGRSGPDSGIGLCMPSLSDSKSQQDTGQLPGKKILLASTCLTVEKKPPTSHVFKVEQRFPTKCREKHRCNLKIKMKETQPSRNVAETVSSAREAADPQRQSGHSTELDRRLCPVEGLVLARWLSTLCIPEEQEQTADKAGDGRALSAGLKSARAAVPVPAPTQTEPAPGTPRLCADASGKERALHKAKPRKKERRNQATASERISNNGKRTRQHTVPEKKDRIKGVKLTLPPNGRELPVLLCTIRQESQAQGRGRNSDVGTRALRSGLPPLPRPHLNTRTQVRGGELSRARGCLPLPSFRALSNTGKTSFAESVHRESLSSVIESKPHCAPRKKAGRENAAQANGITPRGVSATMRICEEPTDDILSSIVKAKYRPQKGGVEMSLEEMWCRGVAWKARRPASAHHSPWRLTEQQRKTLRETRGSLRIQSKSCPSISFLPYLDMIRRRKVKRRDSKSCYLQAQIQKSSDTGKIAWKRPLHVDTPQSTQKAKEHIIQEHEKTETAKALPLKKNTSSGAQEIQWSIQEQEEKAEKVTSTPRVVLTNTRTRSPAASHLQLDPSIEKVGCVIEITKYSLPKGSHRGRNAAKKANEDPSRGGISSSVQEATVCPPREEASVQLPAKEDPSHPEDQGLQHREAPPQAQLEVSKGVGGQGGHRGRARPAGPPSWHRKSTDAVSPWLATPRDWERAEDLAQERQGDARVLEGAVARPTSVALRAKPAPLPRILETETLHVSVTEPVTGGLAGGRVEVVVLSKICPFLAFSTDLHLDTINEDTGGPGASSAASHRGLPESPEYPPPGQTVPAAPVAGRAQSGDRRPEKGKRPALPHGDGAHFQAGASRPPPVLSASEHCALTKGKKAEGVGEKAEQEPARAEEPHVLLTQAPAAPCPARQRVAVSREAWVANTRFSVSSELPKPSGAGETRNAGPREGISSCDWTVKAIRCLSYEKAKDGDKIKEEKGGMVSRAMSWRAERAPSSRQPSRVPPTGKEPDKGILSRGGKAGGLPAESGASFPPPSSLNRDTGVEERDLLGPAKGYFPPVKIQDPCSVGLRAGVKSSDCSVLKGKDRRQADVEEKILPGHVDLKARKFSLTHALRARALQWGSEERERTMQEDKTPVVGLDSICASLATLPYFKCDITGERYTLRIAKLPLSQPPFKPSSDAEKTARPPATGAEASSDLQEPGEHPLQKEEKGREENTGRRHTAEPRGAGPRARKPPVSLTWSRSTLQTSEGPEGRVPAAEREPGRVVPAHTCASGARPLPLPGSPGMELGGGLGPTRPCSSCTSFQESSEAGRVEQAEPETGDTSVPPHQGEGCAPQSRAGEGKGLLLPRPPRKKTRKCQAEAGVVLTTPSSRLSSPHLKVDKGTQVEADLPSPGRTTEAGEGVPSEPARGSATRAVQNEERREPQKERGGERAAHRRGVTHCTRVTLRSTELPRSAVLHRTELHLHIPPRRQTQHQGPGKAPGPAPTLVCVSRPPPRSLLSGNGTQAGHERPGVRRPPPRAPSPPAWPDAEPSAGPEARGGDVREGRRQPQAQCHLRTVAVNIRVRCRQAGAAPVSRILGAKALMLNVNVLTGSRHTGDPEPRAFLTRAFLCTPAAASLDLELGSRVNAAAARLTGASGPQRTLPESPRAQKAEPGEAADGHRELGAESGEPSGRGREAPRRWASDFLICLRGGERPPQVTSRGDARQLAVDSQDEEVYLTGFGTLSIGRRLECLFTGQEAQSGKYGTEARSTSHPCPATEPTSGQKREEEAAAERDSGHRARAEGPPSQPRGDPGSGSPVGSRPRPRPEPNAQPQGSLPKAALGPADSGSGPHTPEAEGHRDSRVRTSPRGSPEDAKAAEARGAPQKERSAPEKEGPTVLADTAQQPRGGGPQPGRKASRPLTWPPPNGTQNTPPRTDACEQMSLCPGARLLPGTQVGGTALGRVSRGCGQRWSASELQASALTRLQDLLTPCWAFSLPGAGQVGETEGGTRSLPHLERKPVKTGKGKFKQGAPVAGRLQEENPGEVSLKEEKLRKGRSQKAPARQAAKPPAQTQTQALARLGKGCAGKQNHGQEQGGPPASPGAQPPVLLPRQVLDSFYAYVPLPPKFEGWRGRVTVADLKRELSPEYLAVKIPHHPVPQILGDLGRGAPGHRMRLEYDFTKPQVFLWHGGASAIAIRSLSVAMLRPPQMKDMKASERKQRRGQRVGLSEAPGRPASTREATWGRGGCSSIMEAGGPGAPGSTPQESQPFPVPEWRMQKPPGVRSEASRESGSPVTPQTEDRAAPGHGLLTRTEEPGSLATEQEEKAPESIPTPTESPFPAEAARERPRSCVQSTQSVSLPPPSEAAPGGSPLGHISGCTSPPEPCLPGPTPDSGTSKVQSPRSFPEPVPAPYQVASNKAERVARAPAAGENLAPLFEAIKNMLESQMERMIQDKVCAEVLKQVRAHSAGAREPPSSAELDPTFRARPEGRPEAVLDRVTAREKRKLTGDLKSKARERKGNLIPARVRQSSQKFSRHPEGLLLGDSGGRWRPGRPGLPAAGGPDTATELSLGHRSPGEATANRVRNLTGGDARGSTKILTMLRSVPPPPRRAFSAPFVEERPLAHVLQKLSIQERERLLVHFSMRTLAMQVKSLPRMVEDSHAMASAQDQRRPPSRCICPAVREPNRQKRIVLLFEEKSLHQIDLDLQYKYQRFLLGLPEERTFPKSKACPRCSPRPNPAARGREVDCGGESARLCAGAAASGKHFSFKEQSPPEQAASIRKVLELAPKHASDPGCPSTAQTDRAIPPKVKFTVTSEKEKKCHVWFQETDACNPFASKLLTAAPRGVDACPAQLAEGCADGLKAMGNPTDLDECPSREVRENEECAFGEVNRCLRREARHTPRGAQKGTPLQRLPRVEKSKSSLPSEAWASCHTRGSKKHTSSGTPPSCGSRQSKTSAPHGLCGGSLNTRHSDSVTSGPSSSSFCEGELCPATRSETSHSLFPLTKSNIKLHLAKSQSRLHRHSERKERKKARSGSQSTNPSQDCEPSAAHGKLSEEPHPRRRPGEARDDPAERCDRFLSRQPPAADTRAEEASLHSDRDQGPPFFYACVPADSLEIIPKTVRWAIPPEGLRKRNVRLPLVAKVSSSCDLFSSSKNLLESFMESFSLVPQN
ncbi:PREDICTED: coiled-coil domain-containing protein 168 [Condylura cristata]|uniref:coiled-coil domain-containing protein 168 n=1 Tax=Condylura cristata TaxID=143302 RepID=UPI0003347CEF|nr:PREDICTED: coiled-coil domain-containing protein 168 [Condylura cristata]